MHNQGKLKFEKRVVESLDDPLFIGLRECPIDRYDIDEKYYEDALKDGAFTGVIRNEKNEILIILLCQIEYKEFVIIAAKSRTADGRLTKECLPLIEKFAAENNCTSVRFGTMRAGLIEVSKNCGYRIGEIIMRKEI